MNERDLLEKLSHPNIVKLKHRFQDKTNIYFLTELAERGELSSLLSRAPGKKLDLESARFIIAELVNTLEYLHSHGIAH